MLCPYCGSENESEVIFCKRCKERLRAGERIESTKVERESKELVVSSPAQDSGAQVSINLMLLQYCALGLMFVGIYLLYLGWQELRYYRLERKLLQPHLFTTSLDGVLSLFVPAFLLIVGGLGLWRRWRWAWFLLVVTFSVATIASALATAVIMLSPRGAASGTPQLLFTAVCAAILALLVVLRRRVFRSPKT